MEATGDDVAAANDDGETDGVSDEEDTRALLRTHAALLATSHQRLSYHIVELETGLRGLCKTEQSTAAAETRRGEGIG